METKNPQSFAGCGFLYFLGFLQPNNWCRRRDSNSHDRGPLPPQDSVSTNSTTSALKVLQFYLLFVFSGAAVGSDAAGLPPWGSCFSTGTGATASFSSSAFSTLTGGSFFNSLITDPVLVLDEKYANVTDVNMKITAAKVVILFKSGTGPSVPNND
jgi:hypothetical protein